MLDESSLKRAILSLERKINKNLQDRIKFPDDPTKFFLSFYRSIFLSISLSLAGCGCACMLVFRSVVETSDTSSMYSILYFRKVAEDSIDPTAITSPPIPQPQSEDAYTCVCSSGSVTMCYSAA